MVEKVFISPTRVRAYGNIINMKTGDDFTLVNSELTVTTDTVDGAEMTVFQFEVEGGISIALVSSSSTCNVGDNVLLTATVLDDNSPVEAAEVTFKVGETVLGTDETDANGVATYTYAASTAGSFNFTASYQDSTSPAVSVSVNHSYSLAFSQATYTASGGSATLECTLLEDNVAMSGASITVTGTDSSTYTATTNSSGVASITVTGISASTAFTATYQGATATCTVTVTSYLFYDDCTTDNTSLYGTVHTLKSTASVTMTYDSTNQRYTIGTNGVDGFCDIPIPTLDNLNNYYIEAEFYTTDTSTGGQPGLVVYPTTDTTKNGVMFRDIASINRCGVLKFANGSENGEAGNSARSSLVVANNWIKVRLEVNGTRVTGKWLKTDDTLIYSYTYTVPYTSGAMRVGLAFLPKSTSKPYYIRNIKAEAL